MSIIVGELSAPIDGDVNPLRRSLNQAQGMGTNFASKIGGSIQGIGNKMAGLGSSLTKYVSLPIAGAAVASFNLGKNFETEMSKITGLVGESKTQVDAWGNDILVMAPKLGKAPQELAEALYFVTSAGIKGADAMKVLELSGKASAAGLGETKDVADVVTSAMNAYGSKNLSASRATDILTAAVREGKVEASELASTMGDVLPIASEMGVSFEDVAGAQASMTKTGTPAAEASTALKSILSGLIKPSKQAEDQLKAMGTSSSEMRKKIKDEGLLSTLSDLKDMTSEYGEEALARVFPNIRAFSGSLDLCGSNLESNKKTMDNVKNSTGMLDEAFSTASETVDFKWNAALSSLQGIGIQVFNSVKENMIPVLDKVTEVITWLGEKFQTLSPPVQKFLVVGGTIAAVLGPALLVVGTIIGVIGGAIVGLSGIITTLAGVISGVGLPVILAIGLGIAQLVVVVTAIVTVIGLFIASFIKLYKNNSEFREKVTETWNTIKEAAMEIFGEIKKTIQSILKGIQKFWKAHGDKIMNFAQAAWELIMHIIQTVVKIISKIIKLVCSIIRGDWKGAWDAVKGIIKAVVDGIIGIVKKLWKLIKAAFKLGWTVVVTVVKAGINRVKSFFTALGRALGRKASDIKNWVVNAFTALVTRVKMKVTMMKALAIARFQQLKAAAINKIKSLVSAVVNKFNSLKSKVSKAGQNVINALKRINFFRAGAKIIEQIVKGITSKISSAGKAAGKIASTIRNKLPFSPAKEGPLKDLDKVDFSSSIVKSLRAAEKTIDTSFLGNVMLDGTGPNFNIEPGSMGKQGTTLNNPNFNFYGVQNVPQFMQEVRDTLRRYGGNF